MPLSLLNHVFAHRPDQWTTVSTEYVIVSLHESISNVEVGDTRH